MSQRLQQRPKVLALDLGVTTGWAYLFDAWKRGQPDEIAGEFTIDHFESGYEEILMFWGQPDFTVIEKPVIFRGPLGDELQGVLWKAAQTLTDPIEIHPSEWKQHPIAKSIVAKGASQHHKDALRLARWFYHVKLKGTKDL